MRIVLRVISVLLMLGGIGLGVVMPLLERSGGAHEIGRWTVYDGAGGFRPQEVRVPTGQTLALTLAGRLSGPLRSDRGTVLLTLTASTGSQSVLASVIEIDDVRPRLVDPQSGQLEFSAPAGRIEDVRAESLLVTVGPGDAETERLVSVDLVAEASSPGALRNRQHLGFLMIGLGFLGFSLSLRRQRVNPNSQPPKPRWGRGAELP